MPRKLQSWLESYVKLNDITEAPVDFHFWTGVWTIAGALRRHVWIDEGSYQWAPNFYIILVAPAGIVAKSTTINIGKGILEQIKGIHFGPESTTWQALTEAFDDDRVREILKTPDGKGGVLETEMSCLSIDVSELGTFLNTEDGQLMAALTRLYDSAKGSWRRRTRMDGEVSIKNPWLNIIAATTPTWLSNNFPEGLIGEGLTSRVIFVYGDKKRRLIAYPSELIRPGWEELKQDLVNDLNEIAKLKGQYKRTREATDWGQKWYEDMWNNPPPHLASVRFEGYFARKQTHLNKLAMVLAASQRDELVIRPEDLATADAILSRAEPQMSRVYESIGVPTEAKHLATIRAFLRTKGEMTSSELWVLCQPLMQQKDFLAAVSAGVSGGIFEATYKQGIRAIRIPQPVPASATAPP